MVMQFVLGQQIVHPREEKKENLAWPVLLLEIHKSPLDTTSVRNHLRLSIVWASSWPDVQERPTIEIAISFYVGELDNGRDCVVLDKSINRFGWPVAGSLEDANFYFSPEWWPSWGPGASNCHGGPRGHGGQPILPQIPCAVYPYCFPSVESDAIIHVIHLLKKPVKFMQKLMIGFGRDPVTL